MKKNNSFGVFIFLCWLAYAVSYVGRMNYSAMITEIIGSFSVSKAEAGLVSSCFFFAYGIGQFVNGMLCRRYNSRVMITVGLAVSALVNFCMPLVGFPVMKYLWTLNGFALSILWSSIIKLQSEYLPSNLIKKTVVIMSSTIALGTLVSYGLSSLFLYLSSWRSSFFISAALLLISAVAWFIKIGSFERGASPAEASVEPQLNLKKEPFPKTLILSLCFVFLCGIANGFIKDGMTTWVPTILYEVHGVEKHFSVLLSLSLPLAGILGATLAEAAQKKLKSYLVVCGLFFLGGGLLFLGRYGLAALLSSFAVAACLMAGINNVLTGAIPLSLRSTGRSGQFAGIINTFCYVGSTLGSALLGHLADTYGWNTVVTVLFSVSLLCGAVTLSVSPFLNQHKKA